MIRVVVVAFGADAAERGRMLEDFGGAPLALAGARAIAASRDCEVRVALTDPALQAAAHGLGLRTVLLGSAAAQTPAAPLAAVEAALAAAWPEPGPEPNPEPLAAVSWRDPFLGAADVLLAVDAMRQAGAQLVLGVMEVRDHPCQTVLRQRTADLFAVARMAGQTPPELAPGAFPPGHAFHAVNGQGELRWTESFPFPLAELAWQVEPGLYGLALDAPTISFEPLDKLCREFGPGLGGCAIYAVGPDLQVRKGVQPRQRPLSGEHELAGLGFFERSGEEQVLLLRTPGQAAPQLFLRAEQHRAGSLFRTFVVDEAGVSEDFTQSRGQWRPTQVRTPCGSYVGPLGAMPEGRGGLLIVQLEDAAPAEEGQLEPLAPPGCGWVVRRSSKVVVNACTGREICGRQDVPELYRFEATLTALEPGARGRLDELWRSGAAAAHKMANEKSMVVRNAVDVLRARVRAGLPV